MPSTTKTAGSREQRLMLYSILSVRLSRFSPRPQLFRAAPLDLQVPQSPSPSYTGRPAVPMARPSYLPRRDRPCPPSVHNQTKLKRGAQPHRESAEYMARASFYNHRCSSIVALAPLECPVQLRVIAYSHTVPFPCPTLISPMHNRLRAPALISS